MRAWRDVRLELVVALGVSSGELSSSAALLPSSRALATAG